MCSCYPRLFAEYNSNLGGIIIPSLPSDDEPEEYLMTDTASIKAVSEYTGFNFSECLELDCYTFKVLIKDSLINRLSKTNEGREYLEDCWLIRQTAPDRESLRKKFK